MSNPDAIWSSDHVRRYVNQVADLDLIAESQVTNAQNTVETAGTVCRAIRSKAAATITVKTGRGEICDLDFVAGETRPIKARTIYGTGSSPVVQRAGTPTVPTTSTDFEVIW